jgi:hypothetical protein
VPHTVDIPEKFFFVASIAEYAIFTEYASRPIRRFERVLFVLQILFHIFPFLPADEFVLIVCRYTRTG